jgi:hypothetical protein
LKFDGALPSYVPKANFAIAVLQMAVKDAPATVENIRVALGPDGKSPLKNNKLGPLILQALDAAGDDLDAAKTHLETWYDASMERVTGWYKRRTQKILFAIGLFAAIVMNVDAVHVGRWLMLNPSERAAIVAQAGQISEPDKSTYKDARNAITEMGMPIGWAGLPQLDDTTCVDFTSCGAVIKTKGWVIMASIIGSAVLGYLITALAIMLGAPFWFDLLSKLMQLRSAVKPETPAPGEKDPDNKTAVAPQPNGPGNNTANEPSAAYLIALGQADEGKFVHETWTNEVQEKKDNMPAGQVELI